MQNISWFNCSVNIKKFSEEGYSTSNSEQHVIQAYTYTEAEAGIHQVMSKMGGGSFEISKITKTNISEVHPNEHSDKWFKAKVALVTLDEESGKERQTSIYMLVGGENILEVYNQVKEIMKGYGSGYVIPSITYTKILEVYTAADQDEIVQEETEHHELETLQEV